MSTLIRRALKTDLVVTAYVYGEFGYGKTSYALWTGYEVLGSWSKVLDYLFFSPGEAVRVMGRAVERGERLPIIIMDDAGLWLDRLTWWEADKVAFMEFFNLIRSVAAGVIFTAPSEELPRQVIRKCFFRVSVKPAYKDTIVKYVGTEGYEALLNVANQFGVKPVFNMAVGYRLKMLPSFMEYIKKEFYDFYPLQYPNSVYEAYKEKRQSAVRLYFGRWRARVEGSKVRNRDDLVNLARLMIEKGRDRAEVAKELMRLGVPRATAYRWIKKILESSLEARSLPQAEDAYNDTEGVDLYG